jgi:EmrB/QacA subfamily drug resistance transporter
LLAGKQCILTFVRSVVGEASHGAAAATAEAGHDRRRWLIFTIVSVANLMASIDQTIVATALPDIGHELHASINWAAWTITIYALGRVLVLPLAGRVSDQYGRRTVFLVAIALFTVSSLLCGLADNIYMLLVLRAVQAIGGAGFMPSATGMVADNFGAQRDRAVGMFTSINPIGGIIGPALGGIFVTYWSWRGIFLVNVPIGVVLILVALRYIPRNTPVGKRASLDVIGLVSLGATILGGMLAISYLGEKGASLASPGLLLPAAVSIAAVAVFIRHTSRAANPFIPVTLLRGHGFGTMNIINFLYGSAALGFGALVPLYATSRYGMRSLEAGTLLSARSVGIIAFAGLSAMALRRTGYRRPMLVGFLLTAGGLLAMALSPIHLSPYMWLALAACLTGIGMGVALPAANNASLQLAPEHVAAVAGLRAMFRQSGQITAVSVTAAILARSSDPGITQAWVFAVFGLMLVCLTPLIALVPEHRGNW